jgi:hypothetical protein
MSSMEGTDADPRWAAAQQLARGETDARMPTRRWMVWLWLPVSIAAVWALGVLWTLVLPAIGSGTGAERIPSPSSQVASGVLLALAIAIGLPGCLWAANTGRLVPRWRLVSSPLTMRDRKWVMKSIRSAAPVDDDVKRSVVLAVAAQNRRSTLGQAPLFTSLVLLAVSAGIRTSSTAIAWLEMVVVIAFLLAYFLLIRDYILAGRYLDKFGRRPA